MPETSSANAALPRRARIWSLRWQEGDSERESAARSLELALGIRPLTARLLCNRGYDDPAAAATFLSHGGMQPHDPFLLTDMQPAVSRVLAPACTSTCADWAFRSSGTFPTVCARDTECPGPVWTRWRRRA